MVMVRFKWISKALLKAQVNGEVYLDSAYLTSEPYGVNLRFDNDPVESWEAICY